MNSDPGYPDEGPTVLNFAEYGTPSGFRGDELELVEGQSEKCQTLLKYLVIIVKKQQNI